MVFRSRFIFIFALLAPAISNANINTCDTLFRNPSPTARSIESIKSLRVMTYNVENLFPRRRRDGSYDANGKPEWKINAIAQIINEINADIIALQEVSSQHMLEVLDRSGLNGQYHLLLIPGNDPHGLEIAFLVKKDLPFELRYTTNKDVTHERYGKHRTVFTRDLPQLSLLYDNKAVLNIYGVHTKSKRISGKGDIKQREYIERLQLLQMQYAAKLVRAALNNHNSLEYSRNAIVLGDFNAPVSEGEITRSLELGAGFRDVFDLTGKQISFDERVTHVSLSRSGGKLNRHTDQVDGILVSARLRHSVESAQVYRYKHPITKRPLPFPETPARRDEQPSDHYPVWADINFTIELDSSGE